MSNIKISFSFIFLFVWTALHASASPQVGCPTILMSGTQITCFGVNDGSANVSVVPGSGSGSYLYSWSHNPGLNAPTALALGVGTYTVLVKDNVTGCTVIGAYVVTQPQPITLQSSFITNVNCFGASTGAIDIQVQGGTAPYTYSWTGGTIGAVPATSQDLNSVGQGSYSVVVKDVNLCQTTLNFSVAQPIEALNSSAVVQNVSCFSGSDGSIDVSVWGGSPPYAYTWDNVPNSQDISNLTAGTYTLVITDVKGCALTVNHNVTQPLALDGLITSVPVSCFNTATGSVSFAATGGTTPYNYQWQNTQSLFSLNAATLSNIVAGNYTVLVTDSKGCTKLASMLVTQPPLLTVSSSIQSVLCHGEATGSINATVQGGTPGYTYTWVNGLGTSFGITEDILTLPAGTYNLTVTDALGCLASLSNVVSQPTAPLTSSYVMSPVLCFGGNTGSIDLTPAGGTEPYTYNWSNTAISQDLGFLISGTYSYGITDANGCPNTGTVQVTQPAQPLTVTNMITPVACFGESNGDIDLTVTGGTSPYTYLWENSLFELSIVSQDLTDYPADDYTYVVTDVNGCNTTSSLTITQPTLLTGTLTGVNILCYGGNNGSTDLTPIGGTAPYSFLWNNTEISEDLVTLQAGTYSVTVTDLNNCIFQDSITLSQPDAPLSNVFTGVNVRCNNGSDGQLSSFIEGGTEPYQYSWSNGDTLATILNLTAGTYNLTVTDFNGCLLTDSYNILQPDPLTLNEVITPVSCFGLSDGQVDVSPTGGTAPFAFSWFNSDFALAVQSEDLTDWPADIYQVEITDSNDCFYEMFFEIVQPEPLVITYTATVATCNGYADADILVEITGGNPVYTTNWSNGATSEDLLDVPAGTYQLVVTDTKGCTDSIQTTITEPEPVTMTFEVTGVTCIDQKDGTALATASGGNGGYYYLWSNGVDVAYADSLANLYYTLLVTDVLGCTGTDSVLIPKSDSPCITPVTAFSPNGDNYNDGWIIDNMYLYPDAHMQIFNRWGNLIVDQTGGYIPWDGKVKGVDAPSDVYYYVLNLNFPDRDPLVGNITIVR
jgi:gliding motility-associated-like protein